MSAVRKKETLPVLAEPEPGLQLCLFEMAPVRPSTTPQVLARRDHTRALWRKRAANYRLRKRGRRAELHLVAGALGGAPAVATSALATVQRNEFSHPLLREIWLVLSQKITADDDGDNDGSHLALHVFEELAVKGVLFWDRGRWLAELALHGAGLDERAMQRCARDLRRAKNVSDENWQPNKWRCL